MGSNSSSNLQDKHVVIIGGGYVGVSVANQLKGKCKLTLIDPKECMHHCVGSLRAVVEPEYVNKIFIPYKPAFGEIFERGTVTNIDVESKKVTLDNGAQIQYDYLVIATGTTGSFPGKLEVTLKDVPEAIDMYNAMRKKIEAARSIVIVGGGPVGVEMAGEIMTDLADKKVTLIHSKPGLVEGPFTESFRQTINDQLNDMGVDVFLDQRVSNLVDIQKRGFEKCTVKTDKGCSVKADLVLVCVGMKTNTEAYSKSLADKMDTKGCLKVNEFLQVQGLQDVFAAGDCSGADEECKMAFKGNMHATVVVANIQSLVDEKPLKQYKPPGPLIIVPIGRNGGVVQFGSWVLGSFVARMLKSKDLFTLRFWREMGQKVPST